MKASLSSYRWDWPTAALMVVMVYTSAARLSVTNWTPNLWIAETTTILGTILGLVLGVSQFGRRSLRWLIAGYSLTLIPWQLMRTIVGEKTAIGQLASLGGRVAMSFWTLFNGQEVKDSLFFVSIMCITFWVLSLFSAYRLMRHPNIFAVIFPSTIPLLIIQYYDGYNAKRIWMLAFYFFIAIMLIGRMNLLRNRERWKEKRVFAGADPEFDIGRGLVIVGASIILFAWAIPTPAAAIPVAARAWKGINQPFENTRKRLEDALAALSGSSNASSGELYGKTMGLGQSALQGEAEVFTVKPSGVTPLRPYWRVRVYDYYADGTWQTMGSDAIHFAPENETFLNLGINQEQTVENVFNWGSGRISSLVTPDYPLWTSRTGIVQANPFSNDMVDLLSWNASPPVEPGDQYRVRAAIFDPTIKELRAAGEDYPDWVTRSYLRLAPDLSDNIRRLSAELTAGKETPYDKVMAVTDYLRNEIEYDLTIPSPPPGIDRVDWFLFTWKSGFCNYYATSEVLLLRAAGIPARMVVGYAPGTYQAGGTYTISSKDAHAWPEVYFPGVGWVEFEPTTSQAPIVRPSGETAPGENDAAPRLNNLLVPDDKIEPDGSVPKSSASNNGTNISILLRQLGWLWVIILVVAVSGTGYAVWRLERQQSFAQRVPRAVKSFYIRHNLTIPLWLERWVRWSEVTVVERAFHAINQSLAWLGNRQPEHVTAAERAKLLQSLLPEASQEIEVLAVAHEKTLYTLEPADPAAAMRAAWKIRYLSTRALLRRWLYGE
jgi:transglutaminase-like putative cysteine protease